MRRFLLVALLASCGGGAPALPGDATKRIAAAVRIVRNVLGNCRELSIQTGYVHFLVFKPESIDIHRDADKSATFDPARDPLAARVNASYVEDGITLVAAPQWYASDWGGKPVWSSPELTPPDIVLMDRETRRRIVFKVHEQELRVIEVILPREGD